jgi:hypothetical protein
LFSIGNLIAERQLSVADYYMPDDGHGPNAADRQSDGIQGRP